MIAAVILFQVTIYKHLGSGPLWPAIVEANVITACKEHWWKTLLYIHNVGEAEDIVRIPFQFYIVVVINFFFLVHPTNLVSRS